MASRAEQKQRAREARLAAEASSARADARRRSLVRLGAVAAAAIVAIVIAIALSSGGASNGNLAPQTKRVSDTFGGIPQSGSVLGKSGAPFTLVEFVDLQCPFCREYTLNALPTVVQRYVRPGKLKLDLKLLTFIGPDSVTAAKVAAGAAQQNRLWQFADLFYHQQQTENTGYVTQDFLKTIANATPGLNAGKALAAANSAHAQQAINADASLGNTLSVNSTPSFFIRRGGGPYEPVKPSDLTGAAMSKALDAAMGS
jgi:protein-disulfide isomerase